MKGNLLWIVMPVYNEEVSLPQVVEEWLPVLRGLGCGFRLCILNDGSKDSTPAVLRALAARNPEILAIDKPNTGHGQTCLLGYRMALEAGATWVFQIDSDGQCDPRFFPAVWACHEVSKVVYGYRRKRDDGLARLLISRVVSLVTLAATGVWVRDANVPYRLMQADALRGLVEDVPGDFHLANIMLSALHEKRFGIRWVDIHFRQRFGGEPSIKAYSFAKQGLKLHKQLRKARPAIGAPLPAAPLGQPPVPEAAQSPPQPAPIAPASAPIRPLVVPDARLARLPEERGNRT